MDNIYVLNEEDWKLFVDSNHLKFSEYDYNKEFEGLLKVLKLNIPYIFSFEHFALLSEANSQQLSFYISNKEKAYAHFSIPKKTGGTRNIDAPSFALKEIQRWILTNILSKLNPGPFSHGFIKNRSIVTNAKIHVKQELVLGIDLKDFFPSIKFNRIFGFFKSLGYNQNVSKVLTELCTYELHLPQGSPASPMLSNLIAWHLDIELAHFCKINDLKFSRYADDITISGSRNLPIHVETIKKIIEKNGFEINDKKTRILGRGRRQIVTGLNVNDKTSISREKKRKIRSIVHNIAIYGPIVANKFDDPYFMQRIYGYLNFGNMVEPDFFSPLLQEINATDWKDYSKKRSELNRDTEIKNSIKRLPNVLLIDFEKLSIFSDIGPISMDHWTEEFKKELKTLLEKCKKNPKQNECSSCLLTSLNRNEKWDKCLKYIFGKYVGNTGGLHHGKEIYDISCTCFHEDNQVNVAFLLKSKRDNNANNSLSVQFYDCVCKHPQIDILAIASPHNIEQDDHELYQRLKKMMHDRKRKDQKYCLIFEKELGRIYTDFKKTSNER